MAIIGERPNNEMRSLTHKPETLLNIRCFLKEKILFNLKRGFQPAR